jgi:serine/threonine-protein kinase
LLAACENGNGEPPDIEVLVAGFDEPERSELRAELQTELERIQHGRPESESRPGSGSTGGKGTKSDRTAETEPSIPRPDPDHASTFEHIVEPAEPGTVEHIGSPNDTAEIGPDPARTIDLPHARELPDASDGTVDHSPGSDAADEDIGLADTTGEHVGAGYATGEHVTTPAATGSFVPASDETGDHAPAGSQSGGSIVRERQRANRTPPLPESVAGYEIISVLGRGAMGVVYKARQRGLKRLVALKMILSGEHAGEQELARFQAEANAVAQLQHPGIVQIYEVGEDGDRPFFSLEFVDGPSLQKKLQGSPLTSREIAVLMQKMADAMAYAHKRGVIHRDLKPANVLLTSAGEPKIGDFGLAKQLDEEDSGLTRTGTVMGTPSYMSPEQATGLSDRIGPLADVYSLGAILYDMLTGRPPFRGSSVMDTLQQVRTREPVPPTQLQPTVPRDLETICIKCLQKEPGKRYADAAALAEDLQRFLDGKPIHARPVSGAEKLWRLCQRNPLEALAAAAAVAFLVLYIVSVSYLWLLAREEKRQADVARNLAVASRNEAIDAKNLSDWNYADARRKEIVAMTQSQIASEQERIARENETRQRDVAKESLDAIARIIGELHAMLESKQNSMNATPEVRKFRAELLGNLRSTLATVANKIQAASTDTYADLYAAELMGNTLMKLGQSKEPRAIFQQGLASAKERVERNPTSDKARGNLGIMEQRLGDVALDMEGDARTALGHYLACRKLHEQVRLHPVSKTDYKPQEIDRLLAHDDIRIGRALMALGRSAEAKKYLEEARKFYGEWLQATPPEATAEPRSYLMQSNTLLGAACANLADAAGVAAHFEQSVGIGNGLLKQFPNYVPFIADQADTLVAYADALVRTGKLEEAFPHYYKALNHLGVVIARKPEDISHQPLLAHTHERLGTLYAQVRRQSEARDAAPLRPLIRTIVQTAMTSLARNNFARARQLREDLYRVEESNLARQIDLVVAMARAGQFADAVRLGNTIRPRMTKSTMLMLQVARCFAICARDRAEDRAANVDQAMSALAIAAGEEFQDAATLLADPDLLVLHDDVRFKELIARIQARK